MKLRTINIDNEFPVGNGMVYYEVKTPTRNDGRYRNNQFCTYHFPPPQRGHLYTYLFDPEDPPSIEQNENNNLRCFDSLQFEHTLDTSTPSENKPIITCGDEVDSCIDGQIVISDITITFRTNERVQKSGAEFLVVEYFVIVRKLVLVHVLLYM